MHIDEQTRLNRIRRQPLGTAPDHVTLCDRPGVLPDTVLVYHDSFMDAMEPYLSNTFAKVVFRNRYPSMPEAPQDIAMFHPSIVIFQFVERNMMKVPPTR